LCDAEVTGPHPTRTTTPEPRVTGWRSLFADNQPATRSELAWCKARVVIGTTVIPGGAIIALVQHEWVGAAVLGVLTTLTPFWVKWNWRRFERTYRRNARPGTGD
jgi:hypothetical protein